MNLLFNLAGYCSLGRFATDVVQQKFPEECARFWEPIKGIQNLISTGLSMIMPDITKRFPQWKTPILKNQNIWITKQIEKWSCGSLLGKDEPIDTLKPRASWLERIPGVSAIRFAIHLKALELYQERHAATIDPSLVDDYAKEIRAIVKEFGFPTGLGGLQKVEAKAKEVLTQSENNAPEHTYTYGEVCHIGRKLGWEATQWLLRAYFVASIVDTLFLTYLPFPTSLIINTVGFMGYSYQLQTGIENELKRRKQTQLLLNQTQIDAIVEKIKKLGNKSKINDPRFAELKTKLATLTTGLVKKEDEAKLDIQENPNLPTNQNGVQLQQAKKEKQHLERELQTVEVEKKNLRDLGKQVKQFGVKVMGKVRDKISNDK